MAKTTNGTRTDYLYDGLNIYLEINGSWSAPTARLTHAGLDQPLLRATSSQTQAYIQDGYNSAVLTTDAATGAVIATQRFDAWGNRIAGTGTVPLYGYAGREPDITGLIHMRARAYDPSIGRFTQADPLGFVDGVNQYAYAANNSVNRSDPLGTLSQPSTGAGGSYFGSALTRLGGAAQAIGGLGEIGAGVLAGVAVGAVTGGLPGVLVAAAPVVHGLDSLQAGLRTVYYGQSVTSVTAQSLQVLGLSETQAGFTDAGIGVALSLGSGAAARIAGSLADNVTRATILFGQSSVRSTFAHGPHAGRTTGEVASSLRAGTISADSLPVEYVIRNGQAVALNNRSLLALTRAGMQPTVTRNLTGNPAAEALLNSHLKRGIPSAVISVRGGPPGTSLIE